MYNMIQNIILYGQQNIDIEKIKQQKEQEHVHLLVSEPPSLSVSKLVQHLKGKTSRTLQKKFKSLKKRYWGQHLWSSGYFCRSVGTVTKDIIKAYLRKLKK